MFKSKIFYFLIILFIFLASLFLLGTFDFLNLGKVSYKNLTEVSKIVQNTQIAISLPPIDPVLYDKKMLELANNPLPKISKIGQNAKKTISKKGTKNSLKIADKPVNIGNPVPEPTLWPVKAPYPNTGAILPFSRVVAFYGNLYSKNMGILGEYPENEMLAKLDLEVKKWQTADPETPVRPALHYIAVVAQDKPGKDGKYRIRMPDVEIDKILVMAKKIKALVFLDVQVGFSNLQKEIPLLEKYLKMPEVHLGIDPEFSMKGTIRPGKIVGTLDADDINFTTNYLAKIVEENNLPPKILVVHRYTQNMLTNYKKIKILPQVEVVVHMDGWGDKPHKLSTYKQFISREPVQFTGFKIFYKNDLMEKDSVLFSPEELLRLNPRPIYIQYQ